MTTPPPPISTRMSINTRITHITRIISIISIIAIFLCCSCSETSIPSIITDENDNAQLSPETITEYIEKQRNQFGYDSLLQCGAYRTTSSPARDPFTESAKYLHGDNYADISPEWKRTLSSKVLRVGIIPDPYFSYSSITRASGKDLYIITKLIQAVYARIMGLHYDFTSPPRANYINIYVKVVTPQTAIPALQQHQIDVIAGGFDMTCDKSRLLQFTQPYISSKLAALTLDSQLPSINSLADQKVCAITNTTYGARLNDELRSKGLKIAKITPAQNFSSCLEYLTQHQVDAVVAPSPTVQKLVELTPNTYAHTNISTRPIFFSFAVRKDNASLINLFNAVLMQNLTIYRNTIFDSAHARYAKITSTPPLLSPY